MKLTRSLLLMQLKVRANEKVALRRVLKMLWKEAKSPQNMNNVFDSRASRVRLTHES